MWQWYHDISPFDFINSLIFGFSIFVSYHNWVESNIVSSALKQREESVFLRARTCRHWEWGLVLHSEREVKPSGWSGAEPFGSIQKNLHICWKLSWAHTASTPVPPHMSHFALLWVSNMYFLLIQKKKIEYSQLDFQILHSNSGALSFSGRLTNHHKGFSKEQSVKLSM